MSHPEQDQSLTPQQRIEDSLRQIMVDPERIGLPEQLHPDQPDRAGENPLPLHGRDGTTLATFKTLRSSEDPDGYVVVIRVPKRPFGDELFNYYPSGKVTHSPGVAGQPPLTGEAATLRLADVLEQVWLESDLGCDIQ